MSDVTPIDLEADKAKRRAAAALALTMLEGADMAEGPIVRRRDFSGGVTVWSAVPVPRPIIRKPWTRLANDNGALD